jgi:riboflavin transporter FmnP
MEVFQMKFTTNKLTVLAMLAAIASLLICLNFPIFPNAAYLKFDFADIPVLVGAFAFGPIAGVMITLIASAIQAFIVTGDGLYGFIMHVIATGTLAIVSGTIYRIWHTRKGAIVGLIFGTLAMAGVMMLANHFVTPIYTGMPTEAVDALLIPTIMPFNLIKAGANSIITFIVYKIISKYIIHGASFGSKKSANDKAF